ncbi:hypothetical protein [Nonomuraea sp. NPDC049695]|uniref:hypothetical protein n=1 Tax=Nonomuraea sp. NPDC049695 TaxID=3154734 RepID=UPI00342952E8
MKASRRAGVLGALVTVACHNALAYQHNSAGHINTVRRLGVGDHVVRMPGRPLERGIVHVTAYGSSPDHFFKAAFME